VRQSPVSNSDIGQIFESEVRGISGEGHGVTEAPWKKVYFVPGTWPGDRIRAQVRQSKSRYGFAEVLEILSPSADRVAPSCQHQGNGREKCGGCPWMIGSYESQIHFKEHRLKHLLERVGVVDPQTKMLGVRPSANPLGYRNRAQLKTDGKKLGFLAAGTTELVDIESCAILSPRNQETLAQLRAQLPNSAWKPRPGDTWIKLDIDESTDPKKIQRNQRTPFRQANDEQNQNMKNWISAHLKNWKDRGRLKGAGLELFCGSGNFTKTLLPYFESTKLFAAEWQGEALDQLRAEKHKALELKDMDLFRHGVWTELRSWIDSTSPGSDVDFLFLDPPRDGLKFRQGLFQDFPNIQAILYVSCDIATLARDLQYFVKKGFRLCEVQGIDQFPHTSHLEVLCALEKV
jgi:23S rRNA (uracil1939-C5)-methyltransferase